MKLILKDNNFEEYELLISDEDYAKISHLKWRVEWNNTSRINVVTHKSTSIGRFLLNPPPNMWIDHINGDTLDNRRENLRVCTPQQNSWNRRKRNNIFSGSKGVYFAKKTRYGNSWMAQIMANGKKYAKYFIKKEDAIKWHDEMALNLHNEFAKLNE